MPVSLQKACVHVLKLNGEGGVGEAWKLFLRGCHVVFEATLTNAV